MSEASFTKGPWEVSDVDPFRVQCSNRGEEICSTKFASEKSRLENAANARLIASAPTMFDALLITEYAIDEWRKEAGELRGVDSEGLISAFKTIRAALLRAAPHPAVQPTAKD